jgi:thymidine kinase
MPGDLTTIVGPMGSGKTLHLVQFVSQYRKVGYEIHLFKNLQDTRDDAFSCSSRAGYRLDAKAIMLPIEIDIEVFGGRHQKLIAFEEGQFFVAEFVPFIKKILRDTDYKVVVTGLNLDFRGEPFGIMPELLAMSDDIIQLKGVCDVCHSPATKTQRLFNGEPVKGRNLPIVQIGGDESYTCRCIEHFVPPY